MIIQYCYKNVFLEKKIYYFIIVLIVIAAEILLGRPEIHF